MRFKIEVKESEGGTLRFSEYIGEEQFLDILIEGLELDYDEAKEFVFREER